jgi:hypothetical protein
MRRNLSVLVVLCAVAALLTTVSCESENVLRILSVNEGDPVKVDISDLGSMKDPDPEETEPIYFFEIGSGVVEMEFQYVQIGVGQPAWTPYKAQIQEITATYTDALLVGGEPAEWSGSKTRQQVDFTVESDPEGKKTTTVMVTIMPAEWIDMYFGDEAFEDPYETEFGTLASVKTKIEAKGIDLASGQDVKATAEIVVSVGNYYDDPDRLGQ